MSELTSGCARMIDWTLGRLGEVTIGFKPTAPSDTNATKQVPQRTGLGVQRPDEGRDRQTRGRHARVTCTTTFARIAIA